MTNCDADSGALAPGTRSLQGVAGSTAPDSDGTGRRATRHVVHDFAPVHVAVACDGNYAMPLAAMLASLAATIDPRRPLVIHALVDRLPEQAWRRVVKSLPDGRAQWNRVDVDDAGLREQGFGTRAFDHISSVCYFRLLLPELLPESIEKVLYLDCDLIIRRDLIPLWDTDIGTTEFAAVPEVSAVNVKAALVDGLRFHGELDLPQDLVRFNSGVLLMNLTRWRRSRMAQRAFSYLRALGDDILWYEQEALNVVARGRYRELDLQWNVPSQWADRSRQERASIIHYLTAQKPWNWDYRWPAGNYYFDALDRTPWAGWRPVRPSFGGPRRLIGALRKALRKRLHATRRVAAKLQRELTYRSVRLDAISTRAQPRVPRDTGQELRVFLAVDHFDDMLRATLEACFRAGADRIFALDRSNHVDGSMQPATLPPKTHVFRCDRASSDTGLRRLLDRFGEGHWCVLGVAGELLVDDDGRPLDLRDHCARFDAAGIEIVEGVTGDGEPLEMTARDLRSGRVFQATALVGPALHAYDPPDFRSRAVLVKYRKSMWLAAGAALSGNARRRAGYLRLRRLDDSSAP